MTFSNQVSYMVKILTFYIIMTQTFKMLLFKLHDLFWIIYVTKHSTMDQVKVFKGYLPQILLGSFLNTLSHMILKRVRNPEITINKKVGAIEQIFELDPVN